MFTSICAISPLEIRWSPSDEGHWPSRARCIAYRCPRRAAAEKRKEIMTTFSNCLIIKGHKFTRDGRVGNRSDILVIENLFVWEGEHFGTAIHPFWSPSSFFPFLPFLFFALPCPGLLFVNFRLSESPQQTLHVHEVDSWSRWTGRCTFYKGLQNNIIFVSIYREMLQVNAIRSLFSLPL